MTVPDELRITDAEAAAARVYRTARGEVDGWTFFDEWGPVYGLPRGASARLGAMLLDAMPHLRRAAWPPRRERAGRGALATAIGAVMSVGGAR